VAKNGNPVGESVGNATAKLLFAPGRVTGKLGSWAGFGLFDRRNFQKGGYWTEWTQKTKNTRCSFHCNCLILG
jgi:hypothetical protein